MQIILFILLIFSYTKAECCFSDDYEFKTFNTFIKDIRVSSRDSNLLFVQTADSILYINKMNGSQFKSYKLPAIVEFDNNPNVSYDEKIFTSIDYEYFEDDGYNNINKNYFSKFYDIESNKLLSKGIFLYSKDNFYIRSLKIDEYKKYMISLKESNNDYFNFANLYIVNDSIIPSFTSSTVNYIHLSSNYNNYIDFINNFQNVIKIDKNSNIRIFKFNDEFHLIDQNGKKEILNYDLFSFSKNDNNFIIGEFFNNKTNLFRLINVDISNNDTISSYSNIKINDIIDLNKNYFLGINRFGYSFIDRSIISSDILIYSYESMRPIFKFKLPNSFYYSICFDEPNFTFYLTTLNTIYKHKLNLNDILNYIEVNFEIPEYISKDNYYKFYNTSIGLYDSLKWEFSNGQIVTIENPSIKFIEKGYNKVKLKIFKKDSIITKEKSFYVYEDNLKVDFDINVNSKRPPYTIELSNKSKGEINSYKWFLDNKIISDEPNPSLNVSYNGLYKIKLEISNLYTKKEISKDLFIFNKNLIDNLIENSELQNEERRLNFDYKNNNFYVTNHSFNIVNNNFGPFGVEDYKYIDSYYYKNIIENNLILKRNNIDTNLIIKGLKYKKAKLFYNSTFHAYWAEKFYFNNKETEILLFKYHDFNGQFQFRDIYSKLYVIYNNTDTLEFKIDQYIYNDVEQELKSNRIGDYLFFNYGENYSDYLFINLKEKLYKLIKNNDDNSVITIFDNSIKFVSLDNDIIKILSYSFTNEDHDTKKIPFFNDGYKLRDAISDSLNIYLVLSNESKSILLSIENSKHLNYKSIDLKIDNPQKLTLINKRLNIFGSHEGDLASEYVINNNSFLNLYGNDSGTFTNILANNEGKILSNLKLNGNNSISYLLLFDESLVNNIEVKIDSRISLDVINQKILLPTNICDIAIYNILGKLIYTKTNLQGNSFDFTFLDKGIYLYRVNADNVDYYGKFFNEK